MADAIYTKADLLRMTGEPLERQYQRIIAKILQAINSTDGDILLCFSGGKDSALLLDMYCEIASMLGIGKSNNPIKVAWANTTNETSAMKRYIPWFIDRCEQKYGVTICLEEVKPLNGDNIITVMRREGLPFISKMVAGTIRKVVADLESKGITYEDIKNLHKPTIQCRDTLRDMGLSATTVLAMTGWSCKRGDFGKNFVLPLQWMPLLDLKRSTGCDINLTEACCSILKKEPLSRLNYSNIMTGEQAVESLTRENSWLRFGCNYSLPDGTYKSKPLGAVSLDAVLYALYFRKVPLCEDYGQILYCTSTNCYKCTEAQRTGCALCGFGIKYDPKRFVRLQETEPAKVACAFKPFNEGGLGYLEVCEYLNEYCGVNIEIPQI